MKLVFWHWSQPTAYLWLLYAYRCFVAQLGAVQQNLAAVVAAREVIYLVSTVVALWFCPVFLLLDLGTVWNEANSPLEAVMRIAMYMLTPHTYIALSLANHFRRWAQVFVCIAAVQVLADISSCYALASLMARNIEVGSAVTNSSAMSDQCMLLPGEPPELERACFTLDTAAHCEALSDHCVWASDLIVDIAPLAIGYGLTAFGFLFFFGPLSISSSFQGCLDKERHRILRLAKAVAGALLLVVWVTIVTVLIWLIGGGNPFCSGIASFILTPCSGHGECYGAAQCHCAASWGPESEVSGTNLCSCPKGFIGDGCNACEAGFIGEHCTTAFMISGANNTNMPTGTDDINGEYVKTEHVCSGKPVYQKGSADGWVLFSCSDDHGGKPCWTVGNSRHARSCRWDSGNQIGNYFCLTSPDDSGCTGMWYERDSDDRNPNPTAPGISVAAVAGMGCELHPDPDCGAHGRCVGRTKDEKKYDSRSCTCDSGWSGAQCDHDPCAAKPCGPHALTCSRNRDGLGYTCECRQGFLGPHCEPGSDFFPTSRIITDAWGVFLNRWAKKANQTWQICYSSFTMDKHSPEVFHEQCDRYATTLTVAHNQLNHIFGGFAIGSWSLDACCAEPANDCYGESCCYTSADDNFLFSLGPGSPKRFGPTGHNDQYQQVDGYRDEGYWPSWGEGTGADLHMGWQNELGGAGWCCSAGCDTYAAGPNEICGAGSWGETDMETWRLVDVQ